MFKIAFYDSLTDYLFSSWWIYLLLGLNFIALGVLIFIVPESLAWLFALFLIISGLLFFVVSYNVWKIKRSYHGWKAKHTIPVE